MSSPNSFWYTTAMHRLHPFDDVLPLAAEDEVLDARGKVDAELAAMQLAMCDMRTRRNALSRIASLPPEVLSNVFSFHAVMNPICAHERGGPRRLGWIAVTHVCRRWRLTALQQPRLWGDISFEIGQRWTEEMLLRAKSAPISIRRMPPYPFKGHELISKHFHHICHLRLSDTSRDLLPVIQCLTSPAMMLISLELDARARRWSNEAGHPFFRLPSNLFANHSPYLRHVKLSSIGISWRAPFMMNLVHLEISTASRVSPVAGVSDGAMHDEAFAQMSLPTAFEELLSCLVRMPELETLALINCLPSRSPDSDAYCPVALDHLKTLTLAGTISQCSDLLLYLSLPESCVVDFSFDYDSINDQSIDSIIYWFIPFCNHRHFTQPIRSFSVIDDSNQRLRISFWRRSFPANLISSSRSFPAIPDVTFSLPRPESPGDDAPGGMALSHILEQIFLSIRMDSLYAFSILSKAEFANHWTPGKWADLIGLRLQPFHLFTMYMWFILYTQ
ncbi:hypothetical protein EVG20_g11665 [Dentipellis fragilis]|uniref:F-box domain-containing protein n=1 Tax=Dentipellis fragilis TaxID=205917 RepID=A0A4Y9XLF3_9AGAM|nr:hypothetical protein EVG20_g11665 [Dentipellis fragilis]